MQKPPVALFSGGPVVRLVDLALSVQGSDGKLSLDDELRRYVRVVGKNRTADWNCPVRVAAALLELAGDFVAGPEGLAVCPPEFRGKVARAADGMDPAEYLRMLAELLRIIDREPAPEYEELAMAGWEFLQTFPHLFGFDAILMDEGAASGLSQAVLTAVTNEHPYCRDLAAAYTTEAQRALVLFPGERCLADRLVWATRTGLREIIDTLDDHMQREHS
ncbi:hypothetical protein AB0F11_03225 [Streptomyces sp. NPDC032472]|uniref:hypothetical protein n=1 Tax=Streptomyces sp. NPDC032472 TaxID=3155018 RepID=UPI0033D122C8